MKQVLPFLIAVIFTSGISEIAFAQCEADYDFGEAAWGAFPDASVGEQFDTAFVGTPYLDVFHVLIPEDASDIEPTINFPLDSVILVSASLVDTVTMEELDFAEVGLDIVCNNNGSSPNPCTLIAPGQYCANLEGTPTTEGVYQMTLNVLAYVSVFGQAVGQPFDFTGYILDIKAGEPNAVLETEGLQTNLYPNPANEVVYLTVQDGGSSEQAAWQVYDITGREVAAGNFFQSTVELSVAAWQNGVYFVSWSKGGQYVTRRLIVNH